jgi:hypothetical protein
MLRTGSLRQVALAQDLSPLTAPAHPTPADPAHMLAPEDRVGLVERHTSYCHSVKRHEDILGA